MTFYHFIKKATNYPLHLLGVGLFFLSHGWAENWGFIHFTEIAYFFLRFSIGVLLFWGWVKWRNWSLIPSFIIATLVAAFYLFFGAIQDTLKTASLSFLAKYTVLLPAFVLVTLFIRWFLNKKQASAFKMNSFLNSVFAVLIAVDVLSIALKPRELAIRAEGGSQRLKHANHQTPNIYLLVLDEYAGEQSLRTNLNFSNQKLLSSLKGKGFYVADAASSNYASTPISMASFFEMNYNDWLDLSKPIKGEDYALCAQKMSQSTSFQWLQQMGYEIKNLSIFDLKGQASLYQSEFLKQGIQLITNKTLLNRMHRDLIWMVYQYIAPHWDGLASYLANKSDEGNRKLYELTLEEIRKKTSVPKFVYTHLMIPHYPYVRDSSGTIRKGNLFQPLDASMQKTAYIEYLKYANQLTLNFLNTIEEQEHGNAIVIIIGDHGFRGDPKQQTCFDTHNNLVAVYLPQSNYRYLYPTISNVNVFKAVFKSTFDSTLVYEKDRCIE